jgi:hypothetical protein
VIPIFCPECGETTINYYRHLHSMNERPYSRPVPFKLIATLGNPALWPSSFEARMERKEL